MSRRVVLVTGAARGQGRSHALRFASLGADLLLVDRCEDVPEIPYRMSTPLELAQTAQEARSLGAEVVTGQIDVRDGPAMKEFVDRAASRLGRLDVVIANAGVYAFGPLSSLEIDDLRWNEVIGTNLTGVFHTIRATAPHIISGGRGGAIVITSSTAARRGMHSMADYTASKHGVLGLMRTFANELAQYSIRVNAVAPTGVATPMVQNAELERWYTKYPEMAANDSGNMLPVELIEAADITNAVVWLASDEARYVTGVDFPVDAGLRERA